MMIARIAALTLLLALPDLAVAETGGMLPPAGGAFAPLPTDPPVQKGMLAIRDLVRTNHSLVTHRRMPPDHAARFAKQVKTEADGILASSRIGGDAREKLRALLDEIVAGIDAVAKPTPGEDPMTGLVRADEALARYPIEFDHPGWTPLQSLD